MAFEIVGSAVVAEGLMGGVAMDALVAGTLETAAASGMVEAVGGNLVGELVSGSVSDGAAGVASNAAPATVDAASPSLTTDAAETGTRKLAQNILQPDTDSQTGQPVDAGDVTRDSADVARGSSGLGTAQVVSKSQGLINDILDWAKDNKTAATIAGTTLAGAVGGIGKASLEKQIAERNIKARNDLVRTQSDEALRQSRLGTPGNVGVVDPSGNKVLYRPDGTPVYGSGGLINNVIRR